MLPVTEILSDTISSSSVLLSNTALFTRESAETLAGPFFGLSLLPYLLFLYFLDVPENDTPKGVTVGFSACLLFVFLTIPAAITAQLWYGVSLADADWLHGSAESLLTVTNLVTVVAFRQALAGKELGTKPESAKRYGPMVALTLGLTAVAGVTALVPGLMGAEVHTPYLNGVMDLPQEAVFWGRSEPENALTVACWIIHISSLVEFLVAMGFAWRWADVTSNPRWKGLTWGLLPLHSSGITACTYHLFYNSIPSLVPLQAFLTCVGNTTAMWAAYRIAKSNGWREPEWVPQWMGVREDNVIIATKKEEESQSLIGFEDLGDALANDNDYTFLIKLFAGCAGASYLIKYGELLLNFPFQGDVLVALLFIFVPSGLNAFKWYKRSLDPTFEGWF